MLELLKPILGSLVRHGLTVIGGVALATDSTVNQVLGALVTLAGVAMSVYKAHKAAQPPAAS